MESRKVSAVIVDDEPLARGVILEYLRAFPEIEVICECSNGRQAVEQINGSRPDIVFLDIQMPGLSGFEVLEQIVHMPHIIFSTADDASAIRAFEAGAIDYLLKPYDRERFGKAVDRVVGKVQQGEMQASTLEALLQAVRSQPTYDDHLFVRSAGKIVTIPVQDVLWIEAAGDYCNLHTEHTVFLCGQRLGELEKRLDPVRFVRVHRSAIVAISAIAQLISDGEGGYHATLRNRARVRISRSYAATVRGKIL